MVWCRKFYQNTPHLTTTMKREIGMLKPSDSAERLSEMIKTAMKDGKLTTKEHNQILAIADEDGILDNQEKRLLAELQEMLANGTIKRVAE
jgi:hypothetical protein